MQAALPSSQRGGVMGEVGRCSARWRAGGAGAVMLGVMGEAECIGACC